MDRKETRRQIILAGDIGGTKTNMAFFQIQEGRLVSLVEAQYVSREYASFDDLAKRFLQEHPEQARLCLFWRRWTLPTRNL